MPQTETPVSQLKINRLTKTQFDSASELSETELYAVDPEFAGDKYLKTDSDGNIVETDIVFPEVDQTYDGTSANAQSGVAIAGAGFLTSSDLSNYQEKATIVVLSATDSITLADNTIYNGGEQTALTIALPVAVDVSFLCEIDFTSGATPATLAYPNTIKWIGDDVASNVFIPVESKRYTIICAYDGVNYRFTVKGV